MPLFFSSEKLPPNKNKPSFIFSFASYGEDTYILSAKRLASVLSYRHQLLLLFHQVKLQGIPLNAVPFFGDDAPISPPWCRAL